MYVRVTETCGIVHELEAELVGVTDAGMILYSIEVNLPNEDLWDVDVDTSELPQGSVLAVTTP